MAYGDNEEAAVHEAKSIAVQVLADMVESGDETPLTSLPACGELN